MWLFWNKPITSLRTRIGLDGLPRPLIAFLALLYVVIFLTVLLGLFAVIWQTVSWSVNDTREAAANKTLAQEFLFFVLRIAGLTTVLGAVVALPITLNRLKIARQNRDLDRKRTATVQRTFFNDRLNTAYQGLYSRREKSEGQGWEDDIIRRNAAIDWLERLARESPESAPDIARSLALYLREMSAHNLAQDSAEVTSDEDHVRWALSLPVHRSDMESAAQALGRLNTAYGLPSDSLRLDQTNLQGFQLNHLSFEGASFRNAFLDGTSFADSNLTRGDFQGARLIGANFARSNLWEAQFLSGATDLAYIPHKVRQDLDFVVGTVEGAFSLDPVMHSDGHIEIRKRRIGEKRSDIEKLILAGRRTTAQQLRHHAPRTDV